MVLSADFLFLFVLRAVGAIQRELLAEVSGACQQVHSVELSGVALLPCKAQREII